MSQLAALLGTPVAVPGQELAALDVQVLRTIDLRPDLMLMVRSLAVRQSFTFRRNPITVMPRGLLLSFQCVTTDGQAETARMAAQQTYVRVLPLHLASETHFAAGTHVRQLTLLVEAQYLRALLRDEQPRFAYLLEADRTFWLEEGLSPGLAALVQELADAPDAVALPGLYYQFKSLALLYELFGQLAQREAVAPQLLRPADIAAVYRVRDALAASLAQPVPVPELVRLSGLNELKLRRLFTQVFGQGLHAYAQRLRMQEAARLLRDERLTVAEVGYQLEFSNLSYFGRLFAAHFGLKPKKWSLLAGRGHQPGHQPGYQPAARSSGHVETLAP